MVYELAHIANIESTGCRLLVQPPLPGENILNPYVALLGQMSNARTAIEEKALAPELLSHTHLSRGLSGFWEDDGQFWFS